MGNMSKIEWVVPFTEFEPEDWVKPTPTQIEYMRRLMLFYPEGNSSEGDVILNYWSKGWIDLSDEWYALRFPIFVYQNLVKMFDMPEDIWDEPFDVDAWMDAGIMRFTWGQIMDFFGQIFQWVIIMCVTAVTIFCFITWPLYTLYALLGGGVLLWCIWPRDRGPIKKPDDWG